MIGVPIYTVRSGSTEVCEVIYWENGRITVRADGMNASTALKCADKIRAFLKDLPRMKKARERMRASNREWEKKRAEIEREAASVRERST